MENIYPFVHILINNWNGSTLTIETLESLYKIEYENFAVIIVDNGSTDNSPKNIYQWAEKNNIECKLIDYKKGTDYKVYASNNYNHAISKKSILIIKSDLSIGFTGANNLSIEIALLAGTDYVLFLNNDTILEPPFLNYMVSTAESESQPVVVGCKIYYANTEKIIWHSGGHISFWGDSLPEGQRIKDIGQFSGVKQTQIVSGCVMLIPRDILLNVGGQDDRYFFNIDDTEYSMRINRNGYKLFINQDAIVWHKVSMALKNNKPLGKYYQTRNTLIWRRDYFGVKENLFFILKFVPMWLLELVAQIIKRRYSAAKAMIWGYRDFKNKTYGECPHVWMNPRYKKV